MPFLSYFNPFLFIRELSCPNSVQTLYSKFVSKLYLDFFTTYILFLVVTLALKKHESIIGLEVRLQSAFASFRALLPSENSSA